MTSDDDPRPERYDARSGHVDKDTLALLALGEPVPDAVAAHVDGCEQCGSFVSSLRPMAVRGRALQPGDLVAVQPPAHVWDRIAAETGVRSAPAAESAPVHRLREAPAETRRLGRSAPPTGNRRLTWLVAAAVVGALVGTAGTLGWQAVRGGGPHVVASATLRPLPSKHGRGSAEVEDVKHGRELSVRVTAPPTRRAYLEVWLMSDPQHLISLGALESSSGSFALPPGLDLTKYKIVDVSVEPYDGDPAHSTDSLVRGALGPT